MEPITETPTLQEETQIELQESVDLCFMLDCTGSMQPYIDIARNKVQEIIVKVQEEYPKSQVRVGIVAYRDVQDSNRFELFQFSTSSDEAKQFLSKLTASGGGDTPEDVNGAFQKALYQMEWQNPVRLLVLIADAPCHGKDFHSADDNHPNGYIEDLAWDKVFQELVEKRLDFLFMKILATTDKMFEKFKAYAEKHGSLENELSFQQEQIPNVSASQGSLFGGFGMALPGTFASASPMLSSGGLFGAAPTMVNSAPKSSLFSAPHMMAAPSSGGLFGGSASHSYGGLSSAPVPSGGLFGAPAGPTQTFSMGSMDMGMGSMGSMGSMGMGGMSVGGDEQRKKAEASFVDNITKNIKAGVYKQQQQMLSQKPNYK